ncbi:hypothetical protein [uncultured Tateyamaria sp.]|uniref:hypothetical protein n=1 Tax=Tateyamaria sp. 1078 TaxID=3417464 RepID=UPI002637BF3C|nr:hypothetical protein [uncultured Tateyamaria sp.]
MSHTNFQDRLSKIATDHAAQGVTVTTEIPAKLRRTVRLDVMIARGLLIYPLVILLAIAVYVGTDAALFHYIEQNRDVSAYDLAVIESLLGRSGLAGCASAAVALVLFLNKQWIALLLFVLSTVLVACYELQMMAALPWLWSLIYTPDYVTLTLAQAGYVTVPQ